MKNPLTHRLRVQFAFVDGDQAGRTRVSVPPLPAWPVGSADGFFIASDINLSTSSINSIAGDTVTPNVIPGRILRAMHARAVLEEGGRLCQRRSRTGDLVRSRIPLRRSMAHRMQWPPSPMLPADTA